MNPLQKQIYQIGYEDARLGMDRTYYSKYEYTRTHNSFWLAGWHDFYMDFERGVA
jgi:hypothetical protein